MKPIITGLDDVLDPGEATVPPLRPRKLTLRVSGARLGSLARPAADTQGAMATAGATSASTSAPTSGVAAGARSCARPAAHRFGLRVHTSPLVPAVAPGPLSPDDYATAEDYE